MHKQLLTTDGLGNQVPLTNPSDPNASLQTPFMVVGSVVVKDDVVETAASFITTNIPAGVGIGCPQENT